MGDEDPVRKPSPRWLEKHGDNRERGKRSRKHEKRLSSSLNGRRIPQSGARMWSRANNDGQTDDGDITTPDFHVEHKATTTNTMSLKREYVTKVRDGARKNAKDPAIAFTFETMQGKALEDWVAVPLEVFKRLCLKAGMEMKLDD